MCSRSVVQRQSRPVADWGWRSPALLFSASQVCRPGNNMHACSAWACGKGGARHMSWWRGKWAHSWSSA